MIKKCCLVFMASFIMIGGPCFEAIALSSQDNIKTLSGIVSGVSGSQIFFRAGSAALYAAEVGNANLVRKYGAPMQMGEVLIGDKVEVKGLVWPDNSISTSYLRNLSLYAHNSTFIGKVASINPSNGSFVLQSRPNGAQNITTGPLTVFKKNGQVSSFSQVELGINETVKGSWERSFQNVMAGSVAGVVRFVNIEITGILNGINGKSLTITADNVIYGVDTSTAKVENKSSKITNLSTYSLGDIIRIQGSHISEGVAITASVVKDLSSSK